VIIMSDSKANKVIAQRVFEIFNDRRLDLLEEVFHPEFRERGTSTFPRGGPDVGDPDVGPSAQRRFYENFFQALPDVRAEVVDVVGEGDRVVIRDRIGGTHRGTFLGRPGTGARIEWMTIHIFTIRDGKIFEDAVMTDALAIMRQLGLVASV
jgi:steroid delta-isomerase-like uncharacterized protein